MLFRGRGRRGGRTVSRGIRGTFVFLVCMGFVAGIGTAWGAGPGFLPGFPLRAGENVMLMWLPFPGATSYNVYKSEKSGGPYQKAAEATSSNYMDPGVPASKTVYYVVKPIIGGKEGEASPEVFIKGVEPLQATRISGHLVTSDGKVSLRWESVPKAAFYNLYRSEGGKESNLLSSVQDTSYTDAKVSMGKSYTYMATAVSTSNVESPKSEPYLVRLEKMEDVKRQVEIPMVQKNLKLLKHVYGNEKQEINSPMDIDTDSKGNVFVLNGTREIQVLGPDGEFLRFIGFQPNGQRYPEAPFGIFVDRTRNDDLYVAYGKPGKFRKFDRSGSLLLEVALAPPDPKLQPRGGAEPVGGDIAVGNDRTIWISESANYQLLGFNQQGEEIKRLGNPKGNPNRNNSTDFVTPSFLMVNPSNGDLIVGENLAQRLSILSPQGERKAMVGKSGSGVGEVLLPNIMSVGGSGEILVVDGSAAKAQAFDSQGKYLYTFVDPEAKGQRQDILGTSIGVVVMGGRLVSCESRDSRITIYQILN